MLGIIKALLNFLSSVTSDLFDASIDDLKKDLFVSFKLIGSIREYKRSSFLALLFISAGSIVECSIPLFMAYFMNQVLNTSFNYGLVIALVILSLLALVLGVLGDIACAKASCGFAKNLRTDMFCKIQALSFEDIDSFSAASLVTRITTDIYNLQNAYMLVLSTAVRGFTILICSSFMTYIMGGSIVKSFIFLSPFLGLGLLYIARRTMPVFRRILKKYDALNILIHDNIINIKPVKAYAQEDVERRKFNDTNNALYRDFLYTEKLLALTNPLMRLFICCTILFILYYGTYISVTSHGSDINAGQISSLLTYSVYILESFTYIAMLFVKIIMARSSASRIVEVLEARSSISVPQNGDKFVENGSVDFENVSFFYASSACAALEKINMHIHSGETIGIIGNTGAGKSTLVQLIPRLYDVAEGNIYIGGKHITCYDLNTLRNEIAIVLQSNKLFSGTIRYNLCWGNINATDKELDEACQIACIDEFIHSLKDGYNTWIEQNGVNLSGGQKQRLYIARTLLKHPKVLILDDSTSAVDSQTERKIHARLRSVFPETTKIIVAQRIISIQDADRIFVMENGRIQAIGSHDELLKSSGAYLQLYLSQNN